MVFPFVILTGYQMPSMIIFLILGPSLQARYHMHLDYLIVTNNSFELNPTDNSNVFFFQSLLSKLCKSKATGLDKISARLLRECADLIARSLFDCIFVDEWKCSKVIPIFKQRERSDLNNYRPISIISAVAKVFERISVLRIVFT